MDGAAALSLFTLADLWNGFFFQSIDGATLALFRIGLAILVLVDLGFHLRKADRLFGPYGVLDYAQWRKDFSHTYMSALHYMPASTGSVHLLMALHGAAALCLLVGFMPQLAALVCFGCVVSLHGRNPFLTNSGDVVIRISLFWMIFADSGQVAAVNALIWPDPDGMIDPWVQRLLMIQISIVYFKSMYWKLFGEKWLSGRAVYYVLSIMRYRRIGLPEALQKKPVYQFFTWATLFVWGALAMLIWIEEFRYPVMIMGVLYHLGMDLMLRIRLFQWAMMTGLLLFVAPGDARAFLSLLGIA